MADTGIAAAGSSGGRWFAPHSAANERAVATSDGRFAARDQQIREKLVSRRTIGYLRYQKTHLRQPLTFQWNHGHHVIPALSVSKGVP